MRLELGISGAGTAAQNTVEAASVRGELACGFVSGKCRAYMRS